METNSNYPLVVDLDETLTRTNTLVESVLVLIKSSPFTIFLLPFWLLKGRAFLKSSVAERVSLSAETLPYNTELLTYLKEQKEQGRKIVLATAAHSSIAEKISEHLGVFDEVLATHDDTNLKSKKKLKKIQENVGIEYVYAGDSKADIPIWEAAKSAILVDVTDSTAKIIRQLIPIEKEFVTSKASLMTWSRAFRIHQWIKNLLLFVPLLTAFSFIEQDSVFNAILGFFAFSLIASGTYVFNDLWDLQSDRVHPRKKKRPFASSEIPILQGVFAAFFIMVLGFCLGWIISKEFLLILLLYLLLTKSYSVVLKEYVLIDVIILSILYTIRIIAGSVAIEVETSNWLLAFSSFIFLSLALLKRCSELVALKGNKVTSAHGRDYQVSDLVVLWPLGVGSALSGVVIFGLFISDPDTQALYATPQLLWLVAIGLIYWLSRLWIITSRGEMHDDPVVYAITNRGSFITVLAIILVIILAQFFSLESIL